MFVNLHVHDAQGSLLDSILTVPELVNYAKEHGQKAIALTNHGYMSSFVDFVKEANKQGVKPLIGNEIYEVDDMWEKADTKDYKQPRYHLVLIAKTQKGFQNLLDITSVSCTEGLYKKPRIDMKYIRDHNLGEGIICLTACQVGRLSKMLINNNTKMAKKHYDTLCELFDDVYIEVQSHGTKDQRYANKKIWEFAKSIGREDTVVITTDAHMVSDDLRESHSIFVQIGESREAGETYKDCCLQTEDDVRRIVGEPDEFGDAQFTQNEISKFIENTGKVADSVEDIDIGLGKGWQMPKVQVPDRYKTHEEYLRYLIYSKFDEKFGYLSKEAQDKRRERIETELDVLIKTGFVDYFIMIHQLMIEAKKRGIPLGLGRGSAAGSLCLYLLDVTQVDSVKFDLDFSRFMNLGRITLPDVDIDLSRRRRREIVKIAEELFGKENVAPICTFNTFSPKVAIRDVGKILNENPNSPYYKQLPYKLRDSVSKMIPADFKGDEDNNKFIYQLIKTDIRFKDVYKKYPKWIKHVAVLSNLPKSMGRHAAGTLITPRPVKTYCPLCLDKEKEQMASIEMHAAMDEDSLQLLKMDFLG